MSREEYDFYIEADRIISGRPIPSLKRKIKLLFVPDHIEQFMRLLRKVEYLESSNGVFRKTRYNFAKINFKKISLKLGFSIPPNTFGPGLYIPHYGTIVVNPNVKAGANCVLHTCTCIAGSDKKIFGDNTYISTGVIISGSVTLGDNVSISANSLVNKSFDSNLLVGGSPAKILKARKPWFECHEGFADRILQINDLRKKMLQNQQEI